MDRQLARDALVVITGLLSVVPPGLMAPQARAVEYTAGPAVAIVPFKGSGPYAYMGKGLADMVITDVVAKAPEKCKLVVVEWEKRDLVKGEIERQQGPEFDPNTRVQPGRMIDPRYFFEGAVTTTSSSISWSLQLRDSKTGKIVSKDDGTMLEGGDEATRVSEAIAQRLINSLCRQGKDYSGRPVASSPPPTPSAAKPAPAPAPPPSESSNDVLNAIKGLKGLFGK